MSANMFWAYGAQFFNVAGSLLLLPLIVRHLPSEEVGMWFVFATLAGVAQLLELGFQSTISRNVTYAYSGAIKLTPDGVPEFSLSRDSNKVLLADIIASSRTIYTIVSLAAAFILFVGGTWYVSTLSGNESNLKTMISAWLAFAIGQVATLNYNYINAALVGRGNIAEANKVVVANRASFVLVSAVFLIHGWGLNGLGMASILAAFLGRMLTRFYFKKLITPDIGDDRRPSICTSLHGVLWHNAFRFGIVQLGAFLILRANLLIATSVLGLKEAASYGLTMTLLLMLSGLSGVIGQVQLPKMNALQARKDIHGLQRVFGSVLVISLTLNLFGLAVLLVFGPWALHAVGSRTELLPTQQLLLLGIILLLEFNHSMGAMYLTTTNRIQFLQAAIWSGCAIIFLSILFVGYGKIWALLLVQGGVQLAYNNWRWPQLALRHLKCSFIELFQKGFHEIRRKNGYWI